MRVKSNILLPTDLLRLEQTNFLPHPASTTAHAIYKLLDRPLSSNFSSISFLPACSTLNQNARHTPSQPRMTGSGHRVHQIRRTAVSQRHQKAMLR